MKKKKKLQLGQNETKGTFLLIRTKNPSEGKTIWIEFVLCATAYKARKTKKLPKKIFLKSCGFCCTNYLDEIALTWFLWFRIGPFRLEFYF